MQFLESIYRAKNLRTLFLLSRERDYEFEMLLSNSFCHFKYLRTLILDCPIKKLPNAVESLIHLRCLLISKNVEIVELPETFCNLCNLQTLNIENHSYFKKLPQGMSKLINLRHLIFHDDYYWGNVVFSKGIGKLIGLRTLSTFNISDKDDREGCKLGELKNLNQLRGALTINGMENVVNVDEAQNAQLKDKIHLRGLVLLFEPLDLLEYEEGINQSFSKNNTKEVTKRTGTRFPASLTSNWAGCICKETVNPNLIQSMGVGFVWVSDLPITSQPCIEQQADCLNVVQKATQGCESVYLKNQGMGARVFSLASVLNVLIVVLGNCEQITYESFSYMMTCEITISVGTLDALFVLLGAMVSKLFTNWKIYANKVTFSFCSMSSASNSDSLSLKAKVLSD
ncbi:putative disease resistance protein rga3 [Quercus suber]|uniref:Disease resistance protein rga3 n=1 Tax=Quercus suber TaxID=58331 RepID=A0AAW0JJD6_QUESU